MAEIRLKKPSSMVTNGNKPTSPEPIKGSLIITDDTMAYYINFAEVGCSPNEFSIAAARIPTTLTPDKFEAAKKAGSLVFNADVQLIIPPTVIPGLIRALTMQKDNYEKVIGAAIVEPRGGQK